MKNKVIVAVFSMLAIGTTLFAQSPNKHYQQNKTKMDQLLNAINSMYVDSVDFDPLTDKAISEMLKELDPHTAFIPSKDVAAMTEPLQGSFDGIGTLIASGFIAGGALMGVVSALLRFGGINLINDAWLASSLSEVCALVAYLLLIVYFIRATKPAK